VGCGERGQVVKRLTQRILACPVRGDGHDTDGTPGDCYRTCLAMLTGADYEDAPHAVLFLSWFNVAREFVRQQVPGGDLQCFGWDGSVDLYGDGSHRPVIATGPSPRGDFRHCVIADSTTGELVHDPHPSRAGLLRIETADAIVPLGHPDNLPMDPVRELVAAGAQD
jgi:hypothetical protein